jgi:hypothetical protein
MSGKRFWLAGLVVLLGLGTSQAWGQTYGTDETGAQPTSLIDAASAPFRDLGAGVEEPSAGDKGSTLPPLSSWLLYPRMPGCCGPVGQHGPIQTELYVRSGIVWPVGGGILVHSLRDGWDIEGGGRALFFDPALQRAWTVGLSISNVFNPSRADVPTFTLSNVVVKTSPLAAGINQLAQQTIGTNPTVANQISQLNQISDSTARANAITQLAQQVNATNPALATQINQLGSLPSTTPISEVVPALSASVASLNQTFMNLAVGREWYIVGNADCGDHWNWRVGADLGGRWGTCKLELNEITHRTDVIGGLFIAGHSDIEVPCGCAVLQFGIRTEYGYTWTDVLQSQNPGDFQSFSLLFNLGVRF